MFDVLADSIRRLELECGRLVNDLKSFGAPSPAAHGPEPFREFTSDPDTSKPLGNAAAANPSFYNRDGLNQQSEPAAPKKLRSLNAIIREIWKRAWS